MREKLLLLVLAVVLSAVSGCIGSERTFLLRVENPDSQEVLLDLPVKPGEEIYLNWIHSSAKTPVQDIFLVGDNGEMLLVEENYQWYGAGLEFTDYGGVQVAPKGKDTRTVLERHFPYLLLRVGWVADQKLTVNEKTIPLSEIAEGGRLLKIWVVEAGK